MKKKINIIIKNSEKRENNENPINIILIQQNNDGDVRPPNEVNARPSNNNNSQFFINNNEQIPSNENVGFSNIINAQPPNINSQLFNNNDALPPKNNVGQYSKNNNNDHMVDEAQNQNKGCCF